jgi:hypothetical protein
MAAGACLSRKRPVMAAMSSAMTRYRIQHLHGAGIPAPQIRDREQVSLRTVERVIAEPAIADVAARKRKITIGWSGAYSPPGWAPRGRDRRPPRSAGRWPARAPYNSSGGNRCRASRRPRAKGRPSRPVTSTASAPSTQSLDHSSSARWSTSASRCAPGEDY